MTAKSATHHDSPEEFPKDPQKRQTWADRHSIKMHHLAIGVLAASCHKPRTERTLNSIVEGMFREDLMPPGSILDVGANDGQTACMLACFDRNRTVHAIDPSPVLVGKMRCQWPNMKSPLR